MKPPDKDTLRDTGKRPASEPLHGWNRKFQAAFARALDEAHESIRNDAIPVIIRIDDRLILLLGSRRHEVEVTGEHYHELKSVCHLALTVYLEAMSQTEPAQVKHWARQWTRNLAAAVAENESSLVAEAAGLCAELCCSIRASDGVVSHRAIRKFAKGLRPVFDESVRRASQGEVQALFDAMNELTAPFSECQLRALHCVVCAGHQPRYKQVTKLFFRRWLAQFASAASDLEHRVLYAEGRESVAEALELVAIRRANATLADVFLHSPLSLDEDLLGDAARLALDDCFGAER